LVIEGLLGGVGPIAADRMLAAIDPYFGLVQLVSLSPDPAVLRWARRHGVDPASSDPAGSGRSSGRT
jgi:uncharacterized membrane protein